ncbi:MULTISPECIES: phenylalanine--tRNA ligase subunit beta [Cellulomonas]|uniref:Phenylalanine--tRNA ligase beta subunit n=1 Tax=Cellulomonas iranensis TaxID=76862 RepID=A0ABU0GGG4_9CELL|nr:MULTISPECIES: phenylalanine--tRNA ligase subunit beta [Cellulomonas]MDQ0423715.1 phenylalanyl-tRNA synthetase beta chain [Cellulomonas iranensis]TFH72558.1 phenylalanine--tRNA ligase subunit beta [Cellulomonas sp. HD19AZ1]
MPRIPLTWLGDHVELPADLTAETLAADLVRVGLEEEAIHTSGVTGPLVVGQVLELTPEPQKNGKTINWCRVDVGAHNDLDEAGEPTVARGIVCGAHNFGVGDRVVVALPGAVLPGPFPIAARKTYGHVSDGMICSARELGLGEDHDGIIVLSRLGHGDDVTAPGTDALRLLGLADEVLEINVTPDRGYCFSMRGVAREYAHSTGARFTDLGLPSDDVLRERPAGFGVEIDDDAGIHDVPGCDRFVAQVVRGVAASAPSPAWLQRRLTQAGMRPIGLAVDVTNYVMLDLGQPMHAYDLATLTAPVVVRRARAGERTTTLDGVERTLDPQDLLVTDSTGGRAARVLGIAGVMGGADSEVSDGTTDLLLEAAHFDAVSVARSSRRHRLTSEASKRFERGVDPRLARVAVARAAALLVEHGGGTVDDALTDVDRTGAPAPVAFDPAQAGRLVGVPYTDDEVRATLEEIGCTVDASAVPWRVTAPTWRPDLVAGVDLVEEVARLRGYDAIPSVVPPAPVGRGLTRGQRQRRAVADALAAAGMVEVLSYPFVSAAQLDALGLAADDERRHAVRLVNPLADGQPLMRTDLLVTLLETARRNVARGTTDLGVFELGLVTLPGADGGVAPRLPGGVRPADDVLATVEAAVPHQPLHVAGVLTGLVEPSGHWGPGRRADHADAIALVQRVAQRVGVELAVAADGERAPFHPGRCARLTAPTGAVVGHAGELHPQVVAALDLPARAVAFEVDLTALLAESSDAPVEAAPVSTFPVAKEDVALVVASDVPAADVLAAVRAGVEQSPAGDVLEDVRLFDVYTGDQIGEGRTSLAFALRLRAPDRTLTAAETAAVRDAVVAEAHARVGAELRA